MSKNKEAKIDAKHNKKVTIKIEDPNASEAEQTIEADEISFTITDGATGKILTITIAE